MAWDYVIVGGGTAGCVLAARLSEDTTKNVLVVETGPDYTSIAALPADVKYGDKFFAALSHCRIYGATGHKETIFVPRGVVTGGSSAVNAQFFPRGTPEDYDGWAALGNTEWSFEKVLPYFKRAEHDLDYGDRDFHGSQGPMTVRRRSRLSWSHASESFYQACLAEGFPENPDENAPNGSGVMPRVHNNVDGIRISAALAYLAPARGRSNLTVYARTLVRRIVFDGDRATAIEIERGGQLEKIEGGQIILCAGALESPHLLMLSGVGPAEDLKRAGIPIVHELPGVGQNLQDHPVVPVLFQGKGAWSERQFMGGEVGLNYTSPNSSDRNDAQINLLHLSFGGHVENFRNARNRLKLSYWDMLRCFLRGGRAFFLARIGLQAPRTSGGLRLRSNDPRQQLGISYQYLTDPVDRERARHGIRLMVKLSGHAAMQQVIDARVFPTDEILGSDAALDEWMLRQVQTQHHSCGTCKMGPATDPLAVVDQSFSVRGLRGLRVIDASAIPQIVRGNINNTVIMMAEKAADVLKAGQ